MATLYIILKRFWSERAHHHKHYQPWVWRQLPLPHGQMNNFPKTKLALRNLILRLLTNYGAGRYRVLRTHFSTEGKGDWRPVVYWVVRPDGKFRILKRYSEHKSHLGTDREQAYWKLPQHKLRINTDVHQLLRAQRRRVLEKLQHRVQQPQLFSHTIRSSTSNRPWKVQISPQRPRRY